ncbi:YitT family protein [Herpetosiphon gulosus]
MHHLVEVVFLVGYQHLEVFMHRLAIRREQIPGILRDYLVMTIGTLCIALALNIFLDPNNVIFGGVTGIAAMLKTLLGLPIGVTSLVLNIPLFIIGLKRLGGFVFGLRTIFATVMLSVFIDLTANRVGQFVQREPLLYIAYGALLSGIGTGLVLRVGGTTGGVDIVARLLQQWRGIRPGQSMLISSVVVFGAAGWIYGATPVLYALLLAFIETRVIDIVLEGFSDGRSALIVSDKPEAIRDAVLHDLDRGVTMLEGRGGYSGRERAVLMCVISQAEIAILKKMIYNIDPRAFVVMTEAVEVLGEGFRPAKAE